MATREGQRRLLAAVFALQVLSCLLFLITQDIRLLVLSCVVGVLFAIIVHMLAS
jgi:hypothetical protein